MKILVLHGPNLNLFGRREPHIYGKTTLAEINARLETLAGELGVTLDIFQSNIEGELINFLHRNIDEAQGALVNPAGLTQHGVPLHDAIKAMPFPTLEVHMSNIAAREAWRAHHRDDGWRRRHWRCAGGAVDRLCQLGAQPGQPAPSISIVSSLCSRHMLKAATH